MGVLCQTIGNLAEVVLTSVMKSQVELILWRYFLGLLLVILIDLKS